MNNNPKISIIVPVYNVEQYLLRCIDSILAQTFTDFEVLLVDDGSKDRSGAICDAYAAKDKRVKTFHKENGGVSSARNLGLDVAKGEWISFIDADDYISNDFYADILNYNSADVIQKSFTMVTSAERTNVVNVVPRKLASKNEIDTFFVRKRNNALWDKIIKREVIGNVRFDNKISIGEDFIFFLALVHKVRLYCFSSVGRYYYVKNDNSATAKVNAPVVRLGILFENIENVKKYSYNRLLGRSIIAQNYVPLIISMSSSLSAEQKRTLHLVCKEIKWNDLRYVSFMHKIIFFVQIYSFIWGKI